MRMRIEPRQAQRRARMSAGAERQPRIERDHDRAGLCDALMVWAYPQTPSEAQRVRVSEPLALPDALGQLVHADEVGVQTQRRSERAPDAGRVVGLYEQALQKGPRPQTELSGQGLEHRIITGVDERDRTRAAGPAGLFRGLRIQRYEIDRQLQVRGHRLAQTQPSLEVVDVGAALLEGRVVADLLVQRHVGLDAFDHHFGQRILHARDGGLARVAVGDDLADQRIIVGRDVVAGVDVAVDADAGTARGVPQADRAGGWHEGLGILGVDAAFHGMTADLHVALRVGQTLACGDQQLRLHQVNAGNQLGHWVLDLDAGVHLDEVELAVLIQELHGAGTAVADRAAGFHAALPHEAPLAQRDARCRRLLDHFLVAPLHRAIALAQVDDVAVRVRQHLEFDVPRPLQEFLQVDLIVAESRARFGLRDTDRVQERGLGVHDAHAAPAAAAGCLDDHRVADVARDAQALVRVLAQRAIGARHARHAVRFHEADRRHLVAHGADGLRLGADEHEAAFLHALGEVRVLGQEAVAGVDRDRVGDFRGADDRRHVEIAGGRGRWPDTHRFIGEQHVLEAVVRGGVHRHGLDAELPAGAQDPQRDLAAVGDDDLLDHGPLFDDEQRLAELDRIAVLGHDRGDATGPIGFDLVHHLHGLDDAQHLAYLDFIADLDEGLGTRGG